MARPRKDELPQYLECHPINRAYYYKNPSMPTKANLGKDRGAAIRLAKSLNQRYRIRVEQRAAQVEAALDLGGTRFEIELNAFVSKYIKDYRLKLSTARLLRQRQRRLTERLGVIQVPAITTQVLREAISASSSFEQSKLRTLLLRFFRYAKSTVFTRAIFRIPSTISSSIRPRTSNGKESQWNSFERSTRSRRLGCNG